VNSQKVKFSGQIYEGRKQNKANTLQNTQSTFSARIHLCKKNVPAGKKDRRIAMINCLKLIKPLFFACHSI
jgi:hypothetical protein